MYGITEKYNADRRGGQALQSLCGRLCGILHKTNERNGTEQGHCHCAVRQDGRAEDGVAYLFAYGSAKLNFLQKPMRHLSQAQEQEIEKLRRKYFPEMTFLGYQILNGEMVEGFQICEQEICRYVAGYAQFYEKNDSMLAYMLENRGEEAAPEKVDQEKYEVVKKRQEERRQRQESGHAGRVEYTGRAEHRDNIIPMPTERTAPDEDGSHGSVRTAVRYGTGTDAAGKHRGIPGGDGQAGDEQSHGAEITGCGGGAEPGQHAGGGGQAGSCTAAGKCCGGKCHWGSRDSDAGRHGKCISGWTGKLCRRSMEENTGSVADGTTTDSSVTEEHDSRQPTPEPTPEVTVESETPQTPTVQAVAQPTALYDQER